MSYRERFTNWFYKKKKEEEPEIPVDWASKSVSPIEQEEIIEQGVWPHNEVKRKKRFVVGVHKLKFAKGLFVVYFLLSLGTIRSFPLVLLLFVPTILLIMDYIRSQETLKNLGAWAKEEKKNDLDNIASVE